MIICRHHLAWMKRGLLGMVGGDHERRTKAGRQAASRLTQPLADLISFFLLPEKLCLLSLLFAQPYEVV